jgi:hypothetical protein
LKRANVLILAITCTACEAVLGFGETIAGPTYASDSPGSDASVDNDARLGAGGSADATADFSSVPDAEDPDGDRSSERKGSEDDAVDERSMDVLPVDGPLRDVPDETGWSPRALAHLALWLDASTGISSDDRGVTVWDDQSPNHHHAESPYPDLRPVLLQHGIGTYPGVSFAGTGDILVIKDDPSVQFGVDDFVIAAVFRHSTPANNAGCLLSYGGVILKQELSYPFRGPALYGNYPDFANNTAKDVILGLMGQTQWGTTALTDPYAEQKYNDDVARVATLYRWNGALTLRINGSPVASRGDAVTDVSAIGADVYIGGRPERYQCLRGVIAELVAASPVTHEETADLESYLVRKHPEVLK